MSKSRLRTKSLGLDLFHPLVKEWFLENLGEPTAAQRDVWPAIARGENALLLAPRAPAKPWPPSWSRSIAWHLAQRPRRPNQRPCQSRPLLAERRNVLVGPRQCQRQRQR